MVEYVPLVRSAFSDLMCRMQSPERVAEYLFSANKITAYELDAVSSLPSKMDKNSKLLEIIIARDDISVFNAFLGGLIDVNEQILIDQWFPTMKQ